MDSNADPRTVLLAITIRAISESDIVKWANRHRPSETYSEDQEYLALVRSNLNNAVDVGLARDRLQAMVKRIFPTFDIASDEGDARLRAIFVNRLRQYLAEPIAPFVLCRMLGPIEHLYISSDREYPAWLGDFYGGCDWIDPKTTRAEASHLEFVVKQLLRENEAP
ncbi:hypothetical protein G6N74_25520 [Mesorhizobium sp. CGMCC 1.15528]|uniref:Uncharacterized protein n=1 Tax=Mesorhizobium zhangyense TaxID=1776730 RepID=A0A7C9RBD9_9HYPH|nr:hypothetical protein [Mesorhizobium zhangyense]NGN44437.1 hypothetical protein [Mesorhizobium zhangyense]